MSTILNFLNQDDFSSLELILIRLLASHYGDYFCLRSLFFAYICLSFLCCPQPHENGSVFLRLNLFSSIGLA